jgi:hypothetical protein
VTTLMIVFTHERNNRHDRSDEEASYHLHILSLVVAYENHQIGGEDMQWLREAQSAMVTDWRVAYRKYICNDPTGKTSKTLSVC